MYKRFYIRLVGMFVLATYIAACRASTPVPDLAATAQAAFETWAAGNSEPYRDVQVTEDSNDGYFAQVRVVAWFRPAANAAWEQRDATGESERVTVTNETVTIDAGVFQTPTALDPVEAHPSLFFRHSQHHSDAQVIGRGERIAIRFVKSVDAVWRAVKLHRNAP